MNEAAEAWVRALESGQYKQGHSYLKNRGFCCLGVACELHDPKRWRGTGGEYFDVTTGKHRNDFLPADVQQALGLVSPKGHFNAKSLPKHLLKELREALGPDRAPHWLPGSLVALNDASIPFPLIARVIRAAPEGLFFSDQPQLMAS